MTDAHRLFSCSSTLICNQRNAFCFFLGACVVYRHRILIEEKASIRTLDINDWLLLSIRNVGEVEFRWSFLFSGGRRRDSIPEILLL